MSVSLLISLMGFTQKIAPNKVPAPVKASFAKKFPAAIDALYEMSNKNYRVICNDKGVGTAVNYSPNGRWLQTETNISESELPKAVIASFAKHFAGFNISEVTKTERSDKPLFYTINMQKNRQVYITQFSFKGDVLKKLLLKK
jgi:hypothetical protein